MSPMEKKAKGTRKPGKEKATEAEKAFFDEMRAALKDRKSLRPLR